MRGLAALLVVYGHVFVVSITDLATPKVYLPMIETTPVPRSHAYAADIYLWPEYFLNRNGMRSGEIGVLLFFLISGLVIAKSLEGVDPCRFLIRRFFRIYPLSATCVFATAVVFSIYALAYDVAAFYNVVNTVTGMLLISGWFGLFYTIPLLWTLMVEVCFYLVMAVCQHFWKELCFRHLLLISAACLLVSHLGADPPQELAFAAMPIRYAGYNALWIIFMLIGSAIWRAATVPQGKLRGLLTIFAIGGIFLVAESVFDRHVPNVVGRNLASGLVALGIFASGILMERILPVWRVLHWLGDISYPLYLIHVPFSWAVIFELTRREVSFHVALLAATMFSLFLAWVLHIAVERPANVYGGRITKAMGQRARST